MNNIENLKDLIIYQSQNNENISVEVLYNEEDFWLTQKSMAKLFTVAENNITYHLQNIFKTGELNENRTTQKIRVVQIAFKSLIVHIKFHSFLTSFRGRSSRLQNFSDIYIWSIPLKPHINLA